MGKQEFRAAALADQARTEVQQLLDFQLSPLGLRATPFSLADAACLRELLSTAGFQHIRIEAHDERVSSGDLESITTVLLRVGPLGKILRENPALRTKAEPRLRTELTKHENDARIVLKAATWIVTAQT